MAYDLIQTLNKAEAKKLTLTEQVQVSRVVLTVTLSGRQNSPNEDKLSTLHFIT